MNAPALHETLNAAAYVILATALGWMAWAFWARGHRVLSLFAILSALYAVAMATAWVALDVAGRATFTEIQRWGWAGVLPAAVVILSGAVLMLREITTEELEIEVILEEAEIVAFEDLLTERVHEARAANGDLMLEG
jgi:hypothetical protein